MESAHQGDERLGDGVPPQRTRHASCPSKEGWLQPAPAPPGAGGTTPPPRPVPRPDREPVFPSEGKPGIAPAPRESTGRSRDRTLHWSLAPPSLKAATGRHHRGEGSTVRPPAGAASTSPTDRTANRFAPAHERRAPLGARALAGRTPATSSDAAAASARHQLSHASSWPRGPGRLGPGFRSCRTRDRTPLSIPTGQRTPGERETR